MQRVSDVAGEALIPADQLAFVLVAAVRRHPHVSNVLTHVSGQNWARVEQTFDAILDPRTRAADLTPLGENIVELMWAERGVTGRLFRPYWTQVLAVMTGPRLAADLMAQVARLARGDAIA